MENSAIKALQGADALRCAAPLFIDWEDTLIWAVLEGRMGQLWVCEKDAEAVVQTGTQPAAACCRNGDFLFFTGDADSRQALQLMCGIRALIGDAFGIVTPQNEQWSKLIVQVFGERAKAGERYAIRKDCCFDRRYLQQLADALPEAMRILPIDAEVYHRVMQVDWARDFCSQFGSAEQFVQEGIGFVAFMGDELIGGASSYIRYNDGIEVQVETHPGYRRMGVATACCAKLILSCMERGLYPSWDAANRTSVHLAEKLGYREKGAYRVWYLNG